MKPKLNSSMARVPSSYSRSGTLSEYLSGFRREPKRLPCKLFYDDVGNRLFDRMSAWSGYCPRRTEVAVLRESVPEIARRVGKQAALVEIGRGCGAKGKFLLSGLRSPAAYIPVGLAREQLRQASREVQTNFPWLPIQSVCADCTERLDVPAFGPVARRILLYLPGSALGNFEPIEALGFLLKLAEAGGREAALLVGIDLKKEATELEAAYNDPDGVTAAFNLNILARANRDCGANFNLKAFRHRAFYDPGPGRLVMQLESRRDQEVKIGPETVEFGANEPIITEFAYKYTVNEFQSLVRMAGFSPQAVWTDPEEQFSLHYLTTKKV